MYLASVEAKVPCGWCVNCRQNKRQSWVYRLQAEAKEYPLSLFVTLTYIIRKTKNSSFKNEKSKKEVDVAITVSNKDIV